MKTTAFRLVLFKLSLSLLLSLTLIWTQSTGCGRLKFNDFKDLMCSLKYWQTAFKNHSKEKIGILKAERLKDALLEVGFQLGTDVISILILRYMRKDGTLRFGDFVSTILHLSVAFSMFFIKCICFYLDNPFLTFFFFYYFRRFRIQRSVTKWNH